MMGNGGVDGPNRIRSFQSATAACICALWLGNIATVQSWDLDMDLNMDPNIHEAENHIEFDRTTRFSGSNSGGRGMTRDRFGI